LNYCITHIFKSELKHGSKNGISVTKTHRIRQKKLQVPPITILFPVTKPEVSSPWPRISSSWTYPDTLRGSSPLCAITASQLI